MPVTGIQKTAGVMAGRGATNSIHNLMPPSHRMQAEGRASMAESNQTQAMRAGMGMGSAPGKGAIIDVIG